MCNILELKVFPVVRTHDNISEFFFTCQTALSAGGVLKLLLRRCRPCSDSAYRRLYVLGIQGLGNIVCRYPELRHFIRLQPYTHRIFRTENVYCRYTLYAFDSIKKVRHRVRLQKHSIVNIVRRMQREIHDSLRRFFCCRYTVGGNFLRHGGFGLVNAVLHLDRRNIGVLVQIEVNIKRVAAVVCARRTHVQHVLDAVDPLLDGLSDSLLYSRSICSDVISRYRNLRLCNIRILGDWQVKSGNRA